MNSKFDIQGGISADTLPQIQVEVSDLATKYNISAIKDEVLKQIQSFDSKETKKQLNIAIAGYISELKKYVDSDYYMDIALQKISYWLGFNLQMRDVFFMGFGLLVGGLCGFWLAIAITDRTKAYICMQAIECVNYSGVEGVAVIDDAVVPKQCGKDDVLIHVKAGAVNDVDIDICNGHGSTLRSILRRKNRFLRKDLPVTLGRSASGVVVEIGRNVTRLDIGDEVWLVSPFWSPGVLSQFALSQEYYVAKKPMKIGFESACSLPYTGGLALSILRRVRITPENADTKRVFVHGGCSAVGCILIQILKSWNSKVTISCYERAVPVAKALGVQDIIVLPLSNDDLQDTSTDNCVRLLKNELDIREVFDVIVIACKDQISAKELHPYCLNKSFVVSTLPQRLYSDSFRFFTRGLFSIYTRTKSFIAKLIWGRIGCFGEPRISYVELDKLSELVEMGEIQTVVDKVFQPLDIEQALLHIQSPDSIGSCVITFR